MAAAGSGKGGGASRGGGGDEAARTLLEDLGRDLTRITAMIVHLAENDAGRREAASGAAPVTARQVAFLISMRHARSAVFGLDLASPGWSVLLELYRARLEGRTRRLSRVATDARIASTTALRWIDLLCEHGLAERLAGETGGRAVLVALTDQGATAMADHFTAMKTGWALG